MTPYAIQPNDIERARLTAGRYARRTPPNVEFGDLRGACHEMLVQAAAKGIRAGNKQFGWAIKTELRRVRRTQAHERGDMEIEAVDHAPSAAAMIAERETPSREAMVDAALLAVPLRERELIVGHVVLGLTLRALGAMIGLSAERVRQLILRGLARMRGHIVRAA